MISYKIRFKNKIYEIASLTEINKFLTMQQLSSLEAPIRILINNITVGIINPSSLIIALINL